jgi:hypothetical protein
MTEELPPRKGPPPLPIEPVIVAVHGPLALKQRPAARSNYGGRRSASPTLIALHCTDGHEGFSKDDDVAAMFANPHLIPERSAGYVVDSDSATQCVSDDFIAWHCGRTGNLMALSVEFCGFAKQTRADWLDKLSLPMLNIGARLVADLCVKHKLPVMLVNAEGLIHAQTGITTHAFISQAFKQSIHTDPGPGFPMAAFLNAVGRAMP